MKLKNIFGIILLAASVLILLPFNVYWYLVLYKDVSSFLAFASLAVSFIIIGVLMFFISDIENKLKKCQNKIEYFEEKLLDKYPELK